MTKNIASKNNLGLFESTMGVVWMLSQSASRPNHTFYRKNYPNEFVANFLHDNMESKKNQPPTPETNEVVFQGQGKPYNDTKLHKVNNFDFCFVPKCFHISNSRPKLTGLDFQ